MQRLKKKILANYAANMSSVTIKLCPFTSFKKMFLMDFGHLLSHFVFYIATDRAFAKTKRLTDISEKHVISSTLVSFQISAGAALILHIYSREASHCHEYQLSSL